MHYLRAPTNPKRIKNTSKVSSYHSIPPNPLASPLQKSQKKSPYFTVQIEGLSLIHMLCNVPAFKLIVLLTVRSAEVEEKKAWQKNKTKLDIE
jgi:hypothetical protein